MAWVKTEEGSWTKNNDISPKLDSTSMLMSTSQNYLHGPKTGRHIQAHIDVSKLPSWLQNWTIHPLINIVPQTGPSSSTLSSSCIHHWQNIPTIASVQQTSKDYGVYIPIRKDYNFWTNPALPCGLTHCHLSNFYICFFVFNFLSFTIFLS